MAFSSFHWMHWSLEPPWHWVSIFSLTATAFDLNITDHKELLHFSPIKKPGSFFMLCFCRWGIFFYFKKWNGLFSPFHASHHCRHCNHHHHDVIIIVIIIVVVIIFILFCSLSSFLLLRYLCIIIWLNEWYTLSTVSGSIKLCCKSTALVKWLCVY